MSRASRARTVVISAIVMAVLVVALSLAVRSIVLSGFSGIEAEAAASNVERAAEALSARAGALSPIARDWGNWDDTYQFVGGRNPGYIAANLTPESISNLGVTHVLYYDRARRLFYAEAIDPASLATVPADAELIRDVARTDRLFDLPELDASVNGVIAAGGRLYLAGAANITDSAVERPARGTIVFLRPLDDALVQALAQQTRLALSLLDVSQARALRADTEPLGVDDGSRGPELRIDAGGSLVGVQPVVDISGNEVAYLTVTMERTVWEQGLRIARLLIAAIALFGAMVMVIVIGVVDRRVLATSRTELERAVAERTRELATSEARFRDLVDHMAQGLLAFDEEGRITFANREAERLFGVSQGALIGRRAGELFVEKDAERRLMGAGAQVAQADLSIVRYGVPVPVEVVSTGGGNGAVRQWLLRDVTLQRRYEQQLLHLASHDHLTGLANRRRFEEELERELARTKRTGHGGGVLWFDLDDFKEVNDTLGHRAGDELLVGVANFLLQHTRAAGLVARIGGDEFAILVPEATAADVERAVERLVTEMAQQRFAISGHTLAVSASVGAVVYPDHGASVEELLSRADVAMYVAKERGSGRHVLWSAEHGGDPTTRTRLEWSERIRHAVENDAVVVFAQPIAHSSTGDIASYELLMRLPGDEPGHLIMPGDFLPAAERLGLIRQLDRWMVMNAIRIVAERPEIGVVFVNLSGRVFSDEGLLEAIEEEFERTGADPSRVGFEITETAAISDVTCARELITGLRRLGCRLALDDFGAGFSSFYYLRNLPIDCVKIDGAFVQQLATSEEDRHLVRAIVELARALGIDTVAEYVEDEETLRIVREIGVTFAQGYHLGRPMPLDEALEQRFGTTARQHAEQTRS